MGIPEVLATMESLPKVNSTTWADEVEAEEAAFGQGMYDNVCILWCMHTPNAFMWKTYRVFSIFPAFGGGGIWVAFAFIFIQ